MTFTLDGVEPPAIKPRILFPGPLAAPCLEVVKSAVSVAFPVDENIVVSIEFDIPGAYPPHHAIVVRLDIQALPALAVDKLPKSAASPIVDIVMKSI